MILLVLTEGLNTPYFYKIKELKVDKFLIKIKLKKFIIL